MAVAVEAFVIWFKLFARAGDLVHRTCGDEAVVCLSGDIDAGIVSAAKAEAVSHQVRIVSDEGGGKTVTFENFGKNGKLVGEGAPVDKWKRISAGENFDAIHERRKRAKVEIGKTGGLAGEGVQIGRGDRVAPQKAKMVVTESIGADNENVHPRIMHMRR